MYCLTYIWKFKGKIRQKQMEKSTVYRKNYGLIVFGGGVEVFSGRRGLYLVLVKINFVDRTEIIR